MIKISEANLSQAMDFTFKRLIEPKDPDGILDYRPTNQGDTPWLRDNPSTGVIFLKKHPNAKAAWILVKFEPREATYGEQNIAQQKITIRTPQEFEDFFGVAPAKNFADDMVITARWDKQKVKNKNPKRDFDETTPNFYRYGNHLSVSLNKAIKGLYRINDIIEASGSMGNLFNIPYSATNF